MNPEQLKDRDYILVIDHSGSMVETDTPSGQSRWDSAKESTLAMATKVQEFDPDGITVIPFASSFKVHENTTPAKVKEVFAEYSPMGGTRLSPVLHRIFEDYKTQKKAGTAKKNGNIVLVVTDGQPEDKDQIAKEISNFTKFLDRDEEFGISFIQVGKDQEAHAFLKRLDDDLVSHGAKFDIVNTKTMEDLENMPLTDALMAALTD